MRFGPTLFSVALVAAFTAHPARAQSAEGHLLTASPALLRSAAALRPSVAPPVAEAPPLSGVAELRALSANKRRQGEIFMIVGAAGIVTGLLVDEDIVTIAGAGVGGYGLFLYLDSTR